MAEDHTAMVSFVRPEAPGNPGRGAACRVPRAACRVPRRDESGSGRRTGQIQVNDGRTWLRRAARAGRGYHPFGLSCRALRDSPGRWVDATGVPRRHPPRDYHSSGQPPPGLPLPGATVPRGYRPSGLQSHFDSYFRLYSSDIPPDDGIHEDHAVGYRNRLCRPFARELTVNRRPSQQSTAGGWDGDHIPCRTL